MTGTGTSDPARAGLITISIAVPFAEGVIVGTGPVPGPGGEAPNLVVGGNAVIKTVWGLLAGRFDGPARAMLERGAVDARSVFTLETMAALLEQLEGVAAFESDPSWVLTYEPAPPAPASPGTWLGAPVSMHRWSGRALVPARWGAVSASGPVEAEVLREGERRLYWALDKGVGFDARLAAVAGFYVWVAGRTPGMSADVMVGLHEADHRFSVDTMRPHKLVSE
ncbi:MAG: hypothetical protein M5U22_04980 [Thermoleophilia bacterium]|nr:hypothetical protein [Thermoleophilia bacterium]